MKETGFNWREVRRYQNKDDEREKQMSEFRKKSKQQLLVDLHILCVAERAAENYNRRKV